MTDLFSAGAVRCIAPASLAARIEALAALLAGADWPVTATPVRVVGGAPSAAMGADVAARPVPAGAARHVPGVECGADAAAPACGVGGADRVPALALPPELAVVDLAPQRRLEAAGGAGDRTGGAAPFAAPSLLADLPWPRRAMEVLAAFPLAEAGGCDLVPVPPAQRPPLLVVSDVDSTLIAEEVIEELADAAGTRAEVARITEAAMRGELDFAQSLAQRVGTLAGVPGTIFAEVSARITPRPFAPELVGALHARGGRFGAVSGGFMEVLTPLGEQLGLDYWAANTLEVAGGALTGCTVGAVVDRAAKATILADWLARAGLGYSVAMGDGANDLDMFASSDLSIALCAKPAARAGANVVLTIPHLGAVAATLWR
ncbi:phosphoserine phosphatase SerB [Buchananella felis]|uniref:phosphoserine phosphatase SerB n=1 Tax=Buchananella felis TaxID=3231492 RepID=UPI003528FF1D